MQVQPRSHAAGIDAIDAITAAYIVGVTVGALKENPERSKYRAS
jgi:hypothetical protein